MVALQRRRQLHPGLLYCVEKAHHYFQLVCTAWHLMGPLLLIADTGRASVDGAVPQHSNRQPNSGAGKEEKVASSWAAAVHSKDKPLALYHEVAVISNSSDGQFSPRSVQTTVCSRV